MRVLLLTSLLTLAIGVELSAQPFDLDTAPDSALWWPASADTTPIELREAYRDPEANRQRYLEAMAAGLAPIRTDAELEQLKFYLNSRLTPELETVWRPLTHLADALHRERETEAEARADLALHGVSSEGSDKVLRIVREQGEEMERLALQIGPKTRELILMHWAIMDREGGRTPEARQRLERATQRRDVAYFVERTEKGHEEIQGILEEGTQQASAIAGEAAVRQLRSELSPEDWEGLRRYLIDRSVAELGAFNDF